MVLHSLHNIGRSLETIVFKDVPPVLFERRPFFLSHHPTYYHSCTATLLPLLFVPALYLQGAAKVSSPICTCEKTRKNW